MASVGSWSTPSSRTGQRPPWVDLVAGLVIYLAGLLVDDVERRVAADQSLARQRSSAFSPLSSQLDERRGVHLGAGLGHDVLPVLASIRSWVSA